MVIVVLRKRQQKSLSPSTHSTVGEASSQPNQVRNALSLPFRPHGTGLKVRLHCKQNTTLPIAADRSRAPVDGDNSSGLARPRAMLGFVYSVAAPIERNDQFGRSL